MEIKLEPTGCENGTTLPLLPPGVKAYGHKLVSGFMPESAGASLVSGAGSPLFIVSGFVWLPGNAGVASKCALLEACTLIEASGAETLRLHKTGYAVAVVTLSDKGAAGEREDTAGPEAEAMLSGALQVSYARRFVIADNFLQLKGLLVNLALEQKFDLICTCGGTGLGPRDVTPQTTQAVLDMELPGFAEAMRAASLAKTPNAVISRAVCGTIGESLVLNLPGSRRAVGENLAAVLPALEHSLRKLKGDPEDCGG